MPKLGDTVSFHFIHTSDHLDDCEDVDSECDCIAKRFVNRPAKVVAVHDDGTADLDVQFIETDITELGMSRQIVSFVPMIDGNGVKRKIRQVEVVPLTLAEYNKAGLSIHLNASRSSVNPPTDQHESGTWTE